GLFSFKPLGWGVVAVGIGVVTLISLYTAGVQLFNRRVGLISSIFYTFSFAQNIFDRHYWGLILDGLWGLLAIISLHQIIKGNLKYAWVLACIFFFAFHSDPSTLVVYILSGLVFVTIHVKPHLLVASHINKSNTLKVILLISCAFLLSLLPLIIFDIRHGFSNSRGIIQYIEELRNPRKGNIAAYPIDTFLFLPRVLARSLYVFGDSDFAKQYSYCANYQKGKLEAVPNVVTLMIMVILGFAFWKGFKKQRNSTILLFLLFASTYLGIVIYGIIFQGDLFDHYVVTILPPFYLLLAFLTDEYRGYKVPVVGVIIIFVALNTSLLIGAKHRYGYQDKINAVNWAIVETAKKDFSLDVIGDCFKYNGYRYLFWLEGKEPVKSYVDVNFTHLYDSAPTQTHPSLLVVITNPDETESDEYNKEYIAYRSKTIKRTTFGRIEVLIVDNSSLQFVGKF
ncbi:MAG: hypothetical protein AAB874_04795, partial [Patescibacteria group bacterium]